MLVKAITAFIGSRHRVDTSQIAAHVDLPVEEAYENLLVLQSLGELIVEVERDGESETRFWSIRQPGAPDHATGVMKGSMQNPVQGPKVLTFDAHGWCHDMALAPRDGTRLDFWYPEIGGYCFRDVFFYTQAQYLRDVVEGKEMDAELIESWVTRRGRCTQVDLVVAWRLASGGPTF